MNELAIFNNPEFGELRTVDIGGEPWMVGKDVAQALGYKEPTKAAREKVDPEDRGVSKIDTPSGTQEMTIINESGLYSLVLSSKLPTAKKFKRWVTSEVLPSIRKNGVYSLNMSRELRAVIVVDQRVTKVQEETHALRQDFEVFKQDMPILGVEETRITEAVKRKGVECLGGKESPSYHNKGLRARVYQDIYRELKRQFGVATYKAIKRNQADTAVGVINEYRVPLALQEQVDSCNAQMEM